MQNVKCEYCDKEIQDSETAQELDASEVAQLLAQIQEA